MRARHFAPPAAAALALCIAVACGGGSPAAPTSAPSSSPGTTSTAGPTFATGTHRIGADIAAGRYYTAPPSGCYWARLSGFSGAASDVSADMYFGFSAAQTIVDILPVDAGFSSDDCGTWQTTPLSAPPANTITPGSWLVGSQLPAGTYRASTSRSCYWERLRDFSYSLGSIIDSGFVINGGQVIVTISNGDGGFKTTDRCGTWTRIS